MKGEHNNGVTHHTVKVTDTYVIAGTPRCFLEIYTLSGPVFVDPFEIVGIAPTEMGVCTIVFRTGAAVNMKMTSKDVFTVVESAIHGVMARLHAQALEKGKPAP